jgi:hypothetical protein
MRLRRLLVLLTVVGACHYSASDLVYLPEHPTFQRDVYPLFSDHCLLCHGSPPNRGAPASFRLDVYDDTDQASGANTYGEVALYDIENGKMPPAAKDGEGVGPKGIQMLRNWITDGKPK